MKICFKTQCLPVWMAGLCSLLASHSVAQTLTTLHSFPLWVGPFGGPYINSDGGKPEVALIVSGDSLYGTAAFGGTWGYGTVFTLNIDGSGFTVLYDFSNTDGAGTEGSLLLSSHTLYGTRASGGSSDNGTVFSLSTDGTGFVTLYSFTGGSDGANPYCSRLVLSSNTLYGTTLGGGSSGNGTVFAINTDGTGFTNLYNFTGGSDGAGPNSGLILSSNTLYGTAVWGGTSGNGTVFRVNIDGTGFLVLHSFTAGGRNNDGWAPYAGLSISGNTLYGTAYGGGSLDQGTVFAVNTDGTGFRTLHNFSSGMDGSNPTITPILSDNTLYGATTYDGYGGNGTVFAVNTNGTGFVTLYSFPPTTTPSYTNSDGANPLAALAGSGNTLYGTTASGGNAAHGTLYRIFLGPIAPPQLTITPAGANVILTWPTNVAGFSLQSTTNLNPLAIWTTNLPAPVVVNGQNTLTNPISSIQQFFRLSQ